ncbi:hypothetical protein AAFF_G00026690 [Aldrovandia affinis]|uniref:Uncharacterized protein n=1 Tax=Aldrovandia affinis TaxID=143900 RepID=A0AAD7S6Y0_9TELE|nr:hypothetical protein AAFF_G00026690 [Aldrovandia affinis]
MPFDSSVLGYQKPTLLRYTRDQLLLLHPSRTLAPQLPRELWARTPSGHGRPRKRGKRGGVRQRLRRRADRPPLPSMILCNARSLKSKVDELQSNTRV